MFFLCALFSSQALSSEAAKTFVNLRWSKAENAVTYRLEISGDKDFKKIILKKDLTESQYKWQNPPVGKFYFRLAVTDKYGQQSDFSKSGEINILPREKPPEKAPPPAVKKPETDRKRKVYNFVLAMGLGYSANSITQSSGITSSNFLNIDAKDSRLGSFLFTGEWWPKGDEHWFSLLLDYSYSSINGNFLTNAGKLSVNRLDLEGLVRYQFGTFSVLGGLGYCRIPVFFIKADGTTFFESRSYFTQGIYIKFRLAALPLLFKTGLQISAFPSNVTLMLMLESYYLFSKWRLGFRVQYTRAPIPVDIINVGDQSIIISGSDNNSSLNVHLMAGIGI
jgi:hypothetical protein